jgi:hypothetical protein
MMSDGGSTPATPAVQQVNPFTNQGGMFGGVWDGETYNQTMTPEMQALTQQQQGLATHYGNQLLNDPNAQMAQQQGLGFLSGLQQDPFAAQQQLFDQQNQLLMPQQEQARMAQESRLFSQGRLGSTGGANDQEALLNAQSAQTQGLFNQSFNQAQAQQAQQAQIGQNLSMLNPQMQGMYGNMQSQQMSNLFGINQGQVAQGQLGATLASSNVGGTNAQMNSTGMLGQGLMVGGSNYLADNLGTLFTPQVTAFNPAQFGGG